MRHYDNRRNGPTVKLRLFGSPQVSVGGKWFDLPLTKPSLLLFYLAHRGDWISREELAFFFRPDADEGVGRHYVRKLLNGARQLSWVDGLEADASRLRWQVDTDVAGFRASARAGRWQEAVGSYRGSFLGGVKVDNLHSYDAWLELEREGLTVIWQDACLNYAVELESSGSHREAAAVAKTLLQHNFLAEDALQIYLKNVYLGGQREVALRAADEFRRELFQETGLDPLETTNRLVEEIRYSRPLERATVQRKYGRRSTDRPPLEPDDQEVAEIIALLYDPSSRFLMLDDPGGVGKEALVIARRIGDVGKALHAIAELSERLITEGYYVRALELLTLTLSHPSCDPKTRARAERLWFLLEPHIAKEQLEQARASWLVKSQPLNKRPF